MIYTPWPECSPRQINLKRFEHAKRRCSRLFWSHQTRPQPVRLVRNPTSPSVISWVAFTTVLWPPSHTETPHHFLILSRKFRNWGRPAHHWKALHFSLVPTAKISMVCWPFRCVYIMLVNLRMERGFYALQAGEPWPRSLFEGRPTGDEMCNWPVRFSLSIHWYHCGTSHGAASRITKMRENCLQQFDAHWNCLELNNQVCTIMRYYFPHRYEPSSSMTRNTTTVENPNEHWISACLRN